jgi:sigma-B regulation protein RsbU (phosphoserine phosphatase)
MFVTAWIGVLDYATGHVDYVNAGHNPPLLWSSELGPEENAAHVYKWRWLTEHSGRPLGLFDGLPYQSHSLECRVGDQFLLYTDGVTEAMDVDGTLYGEDRLETLVNKDVSLHPRELVDAVRNDVARHAEGAEQSDDITILSLEAGVPPEITATLVVPALPSELPRVNTFIHSELDRRLCPMRAQIQLDVAVEELFVNVCHYAYPDATPEAPGMVRVSYTYSAEPPSIQVDIADDGVFYDPMAKPDAVTPDDIMDVPIGGLGILMAKRSVDEMRYERVDGSNITTIVKKW